MLSAASLTEPGAGTCFPSTYLDVLGVVARFDHTIVHRQVSLQPDCERRTTQARPQQRQFRRAARQIPRLLGILLYAVPKYKSYARCSGVECHPIPIALKKGPHRPSDMSWTQRSTAGTLPRVITLLMLDDCITTSADPPDCGPHACNAEWYVSQPQSCA